MTTELETKKSSAAPSSGDGSRDSWLCDFCGDRNPPDATLCFKCKTKRCRKPMNLFLSVDGLTKNKK